MSSHRPLIPLLEADPELGEGLAPADLAAATRSVGVHPRTLDPGPWQPLDEQWPVPPTLGLLVLEGVVTREILFAGRTTTELPVSYTHLTLPTISRVFLWVGGG